MSSKKSNPDDHVSMIEVVTGLFDQANEMGARQLIARFKNVPKLSGWTIGIVVQAPDFEPAKGEIKI